MKILYILRLKTNLLFIKLFYGKFKAKRVFNDKKIYFYRNGKILLFVNNSYNIYVIINIIKNDFDIVFSIEKIEEKVLVELKDIIYNKSKINQMEIQK